MMDRQSFLSAWETVPRGFRYHENKNGTGSFTLPALDALPFLQHAFSARVGGVSAGEAHYLNLSMTREKYEPRAVTEENYRIFCAGEGVDPASMVMDNYAHGTTVLRVDHRDCGKGWNLPPLPHCDGLVTNDPHVTLVTGHADCMAFYFADPVRRAIGLAHAGWRGAFHRIGAEAVRMLVQAFDSDPADIIVGVGPSICVSHFEVDSDLGERFAAAFPYTDCTRPGRPGKAYVDLWQVAVSQFMEAGVLPSRIYLSGVCTYEEDRLYSYRRDKEATGGMAAFLRLL